MAVGRVLEGINLSYKSEVVHRSAGSLHAVTEGFWQDSRSSATAKEIHLIPTGDPAEIRPMKTITPQRLLVVPCFVLLALPGCREGSEARMDPEWLNLEAERVKLAHQVELLELRLSKVANRDDERVGLSARLDQEAERHALLLEKAGMLKDEMAELTVRMDRERSEWLQALRSDAVGRSFERLAGTGGRTFEEVVITRVTDVGIEFRHATGSARLAASELSSAQQGQFGLDPGMAGEALQEEKAIARAYESWVDERVAVAKAEDRAAESERLAAEAARPRSKPQPVVASLASANTRLRDEPRNVGRERYTTWYPYSYSRSRYNYYYRANCATYIPSPYAARSIPNIRAASSSWTYTPRASRCTPTPVVIPRPTRSFTSP
jgi:hypothetical protein